VNTSDGDYSKSEVILTILTILGPRLSIAAMITEILRHSGIFIEGVELKLKSLLNNKLHRSEWPAPSVREHL
jgi:hypothetical protein